MKYSCAKPSTSRNASPYHSDDPGRWTVGRWPRRSPPRGLNRGVGLGEAISSLCSYRFLFFELEPVRRTIHDNGVAFAEIAFEDTKRQRIQHTLLNRALEWARAVRGVVTLADEVFLRAVGQDNMDFALLEPLHESGQLDVDDSLHVLAAERMEEDDFVDAVQELRTEVLAQRDHHRAPGSFRKRRALASANALGIGLGRFGDVLAAEVRRHDDDRILE